MAEQNLNIPSIPTPDAETELPPRLAEAFEDVANMYGQILAPGARARLKAQTMTAYRNREVQTAEDVTVKLTGFLLGDDYQNAKDRYAETKDPRHEAAMKAANPKAFFLDGKKPEGDAPIRAVLMHLGQVKPESRQALEAELADKAFGKTHRDIARIVLAHVAKRDNHHHLVKQPPLPYGEGKVRKALDPWRHHLTTGTYDELARKWAGHMGPLPQHQINLRVAELLAMKDAGRYFRDGEPIKVNYQDPDYQPQPPSPEERSVMEEVAKAYISIL